MTDKDNTWYDPQELEIEAFYDIMDMLPEDKRVSYQEYQKLLAEATKNDTKV